MSGGDDDAMSDSSFYLNSALPLMPTAGDDGHVATPRQNIDTFKLILGPLSYDLIKHRLRSIIETSNGELKPLGASGANVRRATVTLEPTMGVYGPLTGYGMICIFRQPGPPSGSIGIIGSWLKRKPFNLFSCSVETKNYMGSAPARYPPAEQVSKFVKIEDVGHIVHSLSIFPQFKTMLLYFNTSDKSQTVTFDTSELPGGLQAHFLQHRTELGIGNTVQIEPQEGRLIIFDSVGPRMSPGSDRGREALPTNPTEWTAEHVLQWLESLGVTSLLTEADGITGADLFDLDISPIKTPSELDYVTTCFRCSQGDAATIITAIGHLRDVSMDAAFTDLCAV